MSNSLVKIQPKAKHDFYFFEYFDGTLWENKTLALMCIFQINLLYFTFISWRLMLGIMWIILSEESTLSRCKEWLMSSKYLQLRVTRLWYLTIEHLLDTVNILVKFFLTTWYQSPENITVARSLTGGRFV